MYRAPIADFQFVLRELLQVAQLAKLPKYTEFSDELASSVLEEAARFAEAELEPSNAIGDREGARWSTEGVTLPPALRVVYQKFVAAGWPQLSIETEHGGQGMPLVLGSAIEEIWFAGNVALMLCPQLTRGATEALLMAASPQLAAAYVPKIVRGEWSGTMNLTEPQAGSDLGAIRTRAVPEGDHYRLYGQKIFITHGDHDLTDNIVHLVLARIEGAPAGVKGISLFVVPKFLPDAAGNPGVANDLKCVSIEHKLGIHASPTCAMSFGDGAGAVGYLVGEAHHGLQYMFVMMNAARLGVGIQGIGLAERGFQQALAWARSRVQGKPAGATAAAKLTILHHPDVKRMLLSIKSGVEAMRALALYTALQLDLARAEPDAARRDAALTRAELLIPIVKGWSTEFGTELVSVAVQVHGGMGYIEETGVAQTLRDVRITSIYEGTTGIQANDLLGRKLGRDGGAAMYALLDEIERELAGTASAGAAAPAAATAAAQLAQAGVAGLRASTESLLQQAARDPALALAVAVPYLHQCGLVLGGWLMARAAGVAAGQLAAGDQGDFYRAKQQSAAVYLNQHLPEAAALGRVVEGGGMSISDAVPELI